MNALAAQDLRIWMYRDPALGEPDAMIFESAAHVPEGEGWVDTPAKLHLKHKDDHHGQRAENASEEQGRRKLRQTGECEGRRESGSRIGEAEIRLEAGAGPRQDRGRHLEGRQDGPERVLNFDGLSKEALLEIAGEANVPVDKRWGIARIQKALREAE